MTDSVDGARKRYYPDIFVPSENMIIEVKSAWTYTKSLNKTGSIETRRHSQSLRGAYKIFDVVIQRVGRLIKTGTMRKGCVLNMPGNATLREAFAAPGSSSVTLNVFENAGFWTIAQVRSADLDDVTERGIMKKLQASIDALKHDPDFSRIRNWDRVARMAFDVILSVQDARLDPDDTRAPDEFRCPISDEWMDDPVITPDGFSYDRKHMLRWLALSQTDPMTRRALTVESLVPNRALKAAIDKYRPLEQRYLI